MTEILPKAITADRNQGILKITWADGHASEYPFELLRAACPCKAADVLFFILSAFLTGTQLPQVMPVINSIMMAVLPFNCDGIRANTFNGKHSDFRTIWQVG